MVRLVQNSFFGGQLDYEMMGRQDYQRYAKGATKLCNFNIMKRGGLDKRRGFDRVMNLVEELGQYGVTANEKFRAIPFAYKKSHGFVLLMSAHKCIVVSTSPEVQFKYYYVTGLDGVYTSPEIDEIDYQQCGDTLFIAHQNHHPAKIEHVVEGGEHGFHYSSIDIGARKSGVPSITNAITTRLAVNDNGAASLVTESYKVSAVFNGVETLPCTAYKKEDAGIVPSGGYDFTAKSTTQYRAPWTESQKIRLAITVNRGRDEDGNYVFPEQVNVYKKAFNYYGLIGTVKITNTATLCSSLLFKIPQDNTTFQWSTVADSDSTATNTPDATTSELVDAITPYSRGRRAFVWPSLSGYKMQLALNMNASSQYNSGITRIRVWLGAVYYTVSQDGNSVDFVYTGNPKMQFRVCQAKYASNAYTPQGSYTYHFAPASSPKSFHVEADDGESAADFESRWRTLFDEFVYEINGTEYVDIQYANSGAKYALLYPVDENGYPITEGTQVVIGAMAAYTLSNSVSTTFDDTYITPDASITPIEEIESGMLESPGNYPASVSLSQQRLIWASSKNDPQRIWMSEIGDFYSYHTHEVMVPSDSIDFMIPVTRFGKINHICEMRKLLLFNSACEWLVDSSSSVQGLTYETIQAYPQSYSGSSERLKPIICNNSLIFCERTGQSVRRFAYDISNDGFAGRDVSILSSSIFEFNSIVDWTYQQFPYSTLWCVMKDGTLASFEYMEEQDIMAWMTHRLGGEGKAVCVATSYAVSPALDDVMNVEEYSYATHEEIFAVVRRQGSLWLERMRPRTKTPTDNMAPCEDSLYHTLCLDGMRVLHRVDGDDPPVPTTESGAVWIPADTDDGKTISRAEAIAKIAAGIDVYEGFPYEAVYTSVYPSIASGHVGNGQFGIKHIQGCGLRLMHSFGGKVAPIGVPSSLAEDIVYFYNDPENDHRPVFYTDESTGEKFVRLFNHDTPVIALPGVNNRDGRMTISQGDPYPFSVLSYEIDFEPETGAMPRGGVL